MIQSADLVVLPYDSRDQVTSGVLVDAVAAGRPVVATAFPHAVELLASGAGIVVPQRDPVALGQAIRTVLTQPRLAASMAAEARRLAPGLSWPAVARRYCVLADRVVASTDRPVTHVMSASFGHVLSMTDSIGMFEHADHVEPRREHGYCTDDVARLLIVAVREPDESQAMHELRRTRLPLPRRGAERDGADPQPARRRWSLAGSLRRRGLLGPQPLGVRNRSSAHR